MTETRRANPDRAAVVLTGMAAAAVLYVTFGELCGWARVVFARSFLASCLLAVLELALFAVALVLAPAVSLLFAKLLSAFVRPRSPRSIRRGP
jgi:hypothetical protein